VHQLLFALQNVHGATIAILSFGFSCWMAFDCWKRQGDAYWIWLILFSGGVFALIYFFTQYWDGSRVEYGLWKRFAEGGRIRELRGRARHLKTAASYEMLGDAYLGLSKYEEAEAAYREALRIHPDLFDGKVRLGYAEASRATLNELLTDIEFSPRYARARERRWAREAKRLLRA
jgi:tetratricopeptide (TPR) repeat protein